MAFKCYKNENFFDRKSSTGIQLPIECARDLGATLILCSHRLVRYIVKMRSSKEKTSDSMELPSYGDAKKVDEEKTLSSEYQRPWKELSWRDRLKTVVFIIGKIVALLGCLYFFFCSLGLLEDSFQLLGGKTAGATFQNSELMKNPVAGLMIGVLATVLVQSSSTSTSIVITMVGSDILTIRSAIPIIMGANVGTSVTNTLVSLAQASDRRQFRRAFSGATVHDMFNWLSVVVLLPLEVSVHYLEWLTGILVDSMDLSTHGKSPDMLKAITKPLTELIVQVDRDVIKKAAQSNSSDAVGDVLKRWCQTDKVTKNVTHSNVLGGLTINCQQILTLPPSTLSSSLLQLCTSAQEHRYMQLRDVNVTMTFDSVDEEMVTEKIGRCENLFALSNMNDTTAGAVLLVCSLFIIFGALYGIVKVLHSLLSGSLAKVVKTSINADLPGKAAYFTGYFALLVGAGMTMILQSSSVFTSTLTPLVGMGIVSVERMYPLTLGSNIGTTVTGILAALSQDGEHLKNALQVALCHLFFNISGILLFYPLPFLRFPVDLAKCLGKTTAKYRWFAIMYIVLSFIILPGFVFGLSVAGWVYLAAIAGPLLVVFFLVVIVSCLQRKRPATLPACLRSWDFLPLWMHSLKPIDGVVTKVCQCGVCLRLQEADKVDVDDAEDDDVSIVVVVQGPRREETIGGDLSREVIGEDVNVGTVSDRPQGENDSDKMDSHRSHNGSCGNVEVRF